MKLEITFKNQDNEVLFKKSVKINMGTGNLTELNMLHGDISIEEDIARDIAQLMIDSISTKKLF